MSRKGHEPEGSAAGSDASGNKAVWDTGSSLYDSYELAAVRRLLDKRLIIAAAGVLPLPFPDDELSATRGKKSTQDVVPVRRVHRRKVTLRTLFRAVATWANRPRRAPPLACVCAGMVHDQSGGGAAVEPDLPSHGQL